MVGEETNTSSLDPEDQSTIGDQPDNSGQEETIENEAETQSSSGSEEDQPTGENDSAKDGGEESESLEKELPSQENYETNADSIKNNLNIGDVKNLSIGEYKKEELIDVTEPFYPGETSGKWDQILITDLNAHIEFIKEERFLIVECDSPYILSDVQNYLGKKFEEQGYSLLALALTQHQSSKLGTSLKFDYIKELLQFKSVKNQLDRKLVFFVEGSNIDDNNQHANRFLHSLLKNYNSFNRDVNDFKTRDIHVIYLSHQKVPKSKTEKKDDWHYRHWTITYLLFLLKGHFQEDAIKAEECWKELENLRNEAKWSSDSAYIEEVRQAIKDDKLDVLIEDKREEEPKIEYNQIEEKQQEILSKEDQLLIRYALFVTTFFPDLPAASFREVIEILLNPQHEGWLLENKKSKKASGRKSLFNQWKERDDDIMFEAEIVVSKGRLGHSTVQFSQPTWRASFKEYFHTRYANFVQRQLVILLNSNIVRGQRRKDEIRQGVIELAAQLGLHDVENYGHQVIWDWVFDASEKLANTQKLQNELQAYYSARKGYLGWINKIRNKVLEEAVQYVQRGLEKLIEGYDADWEFEELKEVIRVEGEEVSISKEQLIELLTNEVAKLDRKIQEKTQELHGQSGTYALIVRAVTQLLARFSEDDFLSENVVKKLLNDLSNRPKLHPLLANLVGGLSLEGDYEFFSLLKLLLDKKRGTAEIAFDMLKMVAKNNPSRVYDVLERLKEWHPAYEKPRLNLKGHEVYSLMLLPAYFFDIEEYLEDSKTEWPPKHPLLIPLESPGNQREQLITLLISWIFHPALPAAYIQFRGQAGEDEIDQVNKEVGMIRGIFLEYCFRLLILDLENAKTEESLQLMKEILVSAKNMSTQYQQKKLINALSVRAKQQNLNIRSIKNQKDNENSKRTKIEEKKVLRKAIRDLREWFKSI